MCPPVDCTLVALVGIFLQLDHSITSPTLDIHPDKTSALTSFLVILIFKLRTYVEQLTPHTLIPTLHLVCTLVAALPFPRQFDFHFHGVCTHGWMCLYKI